MPPGVMFPFISAAPPLKASIKSVVKTPWPLDSTAYSFVAHAVSIVVPHEMNDKLSSLELLNGEFPAAPELQQSSIIILFLKLV